MSSTEDVSLTLLNVLASKSKEASVSSKPLGNDIVPIEKVNQD